MDTNDVVSHARTDFLNDNVPDYLWSDNQLKRFVHESVIEGCKRAPLLQSVFKLPITIGTSTYTIDESIRRIYTAQLLSADQPLRMTTDFQLSLFAGANWRTRNDTPTWYIRKGHTITLYANPIAADSLIISASVIPVSPSDYDFENDIDPAYQRHFVYYVAYKAFMVRDMDTYNPVKAAEFLQMFNDRFGLPHSAKYDSVSQDSPIYGTVVAGRMA